MSGKRNVSVCRGHELANALYIIIRCLGTVSSSRAFQNTLYKSVLSKRGLLKIVYFPKEIVSFQTKLTKLFAMRGFTIKRRRTFRMNF